MLAFPLSRVTAPDDQRRSVNTEGFAYPGIGADEERYPLEVEESSYE